MSEEENKGFDLESTVNEVVQKFEITGHVSALEPIVRLLTEVFGLTYIGFYGGQLDYNDVMDSVWSQYRPPIDKIITKLKVNRLEIRNGKFFVDERYQPTFMDGSKVP